MTSYSVNNVIIDTHRYFYTSWHYRVLKLFPNFKFWMRIEIAINSNVFFYFVIYWWERRDCTVFFFFPFFYLFYTYCINTGEQYVILQCTLLCCICIEKKKERKEKENCAIRAFPSVYHEVKKYVRTNRYLNPHSKFKIRK